MSGWQLSGDAPIAYNRFALKVMEPWTDDLILAAGCRDGDRVLDVACGTGIVANRIGLVTGKLCSITGIDPNEGMLSVARRNPQIEWHQGNATGLTSRAYCRVVIGRSSRRSRIIAPRWRAAATRSAASGCAWFSDTNCDILVVPTGRSGEPRYQFMP